MRAKLKVSFDGPQHGWITLSLDSGHDAVQFSVEHVPFDLITELASALRDLLCGRPSAMARGNDGPIAYQLVFEQAEGLINLRVFADYEKFAGKTRDELFAYADARYQVVRPFWKALRDLETKQTLTAYQAQWREVFPVREMSLLMDKIKETKHERSRESD